MPRNPLNGFIRTFCTQRGMLCLARFERITQLFEETRDHAYRDSLTGLPNYRLFREHLDQEMIRAERTRSL